MSLQVLKRNGIEASCLEMDIHFRFILVLTTVKPLLTAISYFHALSALQHCGQHREAFVERFSHVTRLQCFFFPTFWKWSELLDSIIHKTIRLQPPLSRLRPKTDRGLNSVEPLPSAFSSIPQKEPRLSKHNFPLELSSLGCTPVMS